MKQVMLSPYECANPNCTSKKPMQGNQDTGGITHINHKDTWYTGYICKQCANTSTATMSKSASRNLRFALQANIAERQLKEQKPWKPATKQTPKETKPTPSWEAIQKTDKKETRNEFTWLHQWLNNPKLQELFQNHNELRAFAITYGYRVIDAKQIIEHKKTRNEEMV